MKVVKAVAAALVIAGAILLFGTAGASDAGVIEFGKAVEQCLVSIGMVICGTAAAYIIEKKESVK